MGASDIKEVYRTEIKRAKIGNRGKLVAITNMSVRDVRILWAYRRQTTSQSELARDFKLCNQRISQIVAKGLNKIKLYNRTGESNWLYK